jgi:hypothetical protein
MLETILAQILALRDNPATRNLVADLRTLTDPIPAARAVLSSVHDYVLFQKAICEHPGGPVLGNHFPPAHAHHVLTADGRIHPAGTRESVQPKTPVLYWCDSPSGWYRVPTESAND